MASPRPHPQVFTILGPNRPSQAASLKGRVIARWKPSPSDKNNSWAAESDVGPWHEIKALQLARPDSSWWSGAWSILKTLKFVQGSFENGILGVARRPKNGVDSGSEPWKVFKISRFALPAAFWLLLPAPVRDKISSLKGFPSDPLAPETLAFHTVVSRECTWTLSPTLKHPQICYHPIPSFTQQWNWDISQGQGWGEHHLKYLKYWLRDKALFPQCEIHLKFNKHVYIYICSHAIHTWSTRTCKILRVNAKLSAIFGKSRKP